MENTVEQLKPKDWEERKDVRADIVTTHKKTFGTLKFITSLPFVGFFMIILAASFFLDGPKELTLSVFFILVFLMLLDGIRRAVEGDIKETKPMDSDDSDESNPFLFSQVYSSFESNIHHDNLH